MWPTKTAESNAEKKLIDYVSCDNQKTPATMQDAIGFMSDNSRQVDGIWVRRFA
jgi:hypothetical protein